MKAKIINSYALELLKSLIISDIDEAKLQAKVYKEEARQQECSKRDQTIIDNANNSRKFWSNRSDVLHECLVNIERYSSEVEI